MECGTARAIELPKQTRGAEIRAASFDKGDNSIEIVWTSGATVRRRSYRGEVYDEQLIVTPEAVNLERLNAGAAPFLNSHSAYDLSTVIGTVVAGSARIENGQGVARVKLSSAPSDANVVHKIKKGIIRSVSTGYTVDRAEVVERSGDAPLLARHEVDTARIERRRYWRRCRCTYPQRSDDVPVHDRLGNAQPAAGSVLWRAVRPRCGRAMKIGTRSGRASWRPHALFPSRADAA